jgi:hypothetical protein
MSTPPQPTPVSQTPTPPTPATAAQLQQTQANFEERMSAFERSMIRLTRYGLFVTVVTGAIFAGQLYEMISGGTQTDKLVEYASKQATAADRISKASDDFTDSAYWIEQHMDDAANAMQDSVDTADRNTKRTIRNAEIAFQAEQRAWVGFQSVSSSGFTETEPLKIEIAFFNSGRTPARNVQSSGLFTVSETPISGPSPEQIKLLVYQPAQSIPPQGTYRLNLGSDFLGEAKTELQIHGQQILVSQYHSIKNKTLILYYYGIVKYDDASGKHRETQYCIYLANPDTKQVGTCDAFNDLN